MRSRPAARRSCATGRTRTRSARRTRTRRSSRSRRSPTFEGGGKAGILGGHNLVVSAYSKNPGGALALINYLTSEEAITRDAVDYSLAPVLESVYDDPAVQKALPFAPQLKQAIAQAKSRPVSPVYTQISQAIYKNVNAALSGQTSPEDALKTGQSEMEKALATF